MEGEGKRGQQRDEHDPPARKQWISATASSPRTHRRATPNPAPHSISPITLIPITSPTRSPITPFLPSSFTLPSVSVIIPPTMTPFGPTTLSPLLPSTLPLQPVVLYPLSPSSPPPNRCMYHPYPRFACTPPMDLSHTLRSSCPRTHTAQPSILPPIASTSISYHPSHPILPIPSSCITLPTSSCITPPAKH